MDVRIGIIQTIKELEIELPEGTKREDVLADVEKALGQPDGVLWLTDKRDRSVAVPSARIAYVEVGSSGDARRVGFANT